MPEIFDDTLGTIIVQRSARAKQIKIRVTPDGKLKASVPMYTPLFMVKRVVKTSHKSIQQLLDSSQPKLELENGQRIGKSHSLIVDTGPGLKIARVGQHIRLSLPADTDLNNPSVHKALRPVMVQALRKEAKSYLPRRLKFIADNHGLSYSSVRFSHASSRWGSCSSNGTISLNIALMKLSFELIDYVLIHELSHTVHMNHSQEFWRLVETIDPSYKAHRKLIKQETPSI
ncbi:MAG: M48 family metallopeptidase [bacterium]|nr:M48 family metallopeptidase [bacterium]MDN5835337.1 M48 family metallopeptidase [bacterium]